MQKTPFEKFKNKAVYIAGYPKSGTTLLSALLDYHPQLVVFPFEMQYLLKNVGLEMLYNKKLSRQEKIDYVLHRMELLNPAQTDHGIFGDKCVVGNLDFSDIDYNFFIQKLKERLDQAKDDKDFVLAIIETFYDAEHSEAQDKRAWVEKTPHNYLFFPLLKKWFGDDLVYLHIVRDPLDTFSSYRHKIKTHLDVDIFCRDWYFSKMLAEKAKKKIKKYYIIKYEELVTYPESVMKQVAEWLHIDFNDSLLKPTKNGKPWLGNSSHYKEYAAVSRDSIGIHRGLLADYEIKRINELLYKFNIRFRLKVYKRLLRFELMWRCPNVYKFFYKYFSKKQ